MLVIAWVSQTIWMKYKIQNVQLSFVYQFLKNLKIVHYNDFSQIVNSRNTLCKTKKRALSKARPCLGIRNNMLVMLNVQVGRRHVHASERWARAGNLQEANAFEILKIDMACTTTHEIHCSNNTQWMYVKPQPNICVPNAKILVYIKSAVT